MERENFLISKILSKLDQHPQLIYLFIKFLRSHLFQTDRRFSTWDLTVSRLCSSVQRLTLNSFIRDIEVEFRIFNFDGTKICFRLSGDLLLAITRLFMKQVTDLMRKLAELWNISKQSKKCKSGGQQGCLDGVPELPDEATIQEQLEEAVKQAPAIMERVAAELATQDLSSITMPDSPPVEDEASKIFLDDYDEDVGFAMADVSKRFPHEYEIDLREPMSFEEQFVLEQQASARTPPQDHLQVPTPRHQDSTGRGDGPSKGASPFSNLPVPSAPTATPRNYYLEGAIPKWKDPKNDEIIVLPSPSHEIPGPSFQPEYESPRIHPASSMPVLNIMPRPGQISSPEGSPGSHIIQVQAIFHAQNDYEGIPAPEMPRRDDRRQDAQRPVIEEMDMEEGIHDEPVIHIAPQPEIHIANEGDVRMHEPEIHPAPQEDIPAAQEVPEVDMQGVAAAQPPVQRPRARRGQRRNVVNRRAQVPKRTLSLYALDFPLKFTDVPPTEEVMYDALRPLRDRTRPRRIEFLRRFQMAEIRSSNFVVPECTIDNRTEVMDQETEAYLNEIAHFQPGQTPPPRESFATSLALREEAKRVRRLQRRDSSLNLRHEPQVGERTFAPQDLPGAPLQDQNVPQQPPVDEPMVFEAPEQAELHVPVPERSGFVPPPVDERSMFETDYGRAQEVVEPMDVAAPRTRTPEPEPVPRPSKRRPATEDIPQARRSPPLQDEACQLAERAGEDQHPGIQPRVPVYVSRRLPPVVADFPVARLDRADPGITEESVMESIRQIWAESSSRDPIPFKTLCKPGSLRATAGRMMMILLALAKAEKIQLEQGAPGETLIFPPRPSRSNQDQEEPSPSSSRER